MFLLVFPNQLYLNHPGLALQPELVVLIEDSLYFGDWNYPANFHKQKLWLHRASMKRYNDWLQENGWATDYLEYDSKQHSLDRHLNYLLKTYEFSDRRVAVVDPVDFILKRRLESFCKSHRLELQILDSPGFINSGTDNHDYRTNHKRWFMADFYKWQRKRLNILMDKGEPRGGKWSFDADNRKKIPAKQLDAIPSLPDVSRDQHDEEAKKYVLKRFPTALGKLDSLYYPTSHAAAEKWLDSFLRQRLNHFGEYEDAIVEGEFWLWHSVLTPALNIGLLTPEGIVAKTLRYEQSHDIPLNSLEGFLRQIIGWREFMRATYEDLGVDMRTGNHWQHTRTLPQCFYDGTTGIVPVDDCIKRLLQTGYCHHIERLMVLGGFMFLCEFDPKDVYRWFMEMFVDSYDWVMVPNVFAMSQNAEGGLITTKPYFSGSSYVRKMSHYRDGEWCQIWDGLYWRWIWNHHQELQNNPRWAMMFSMVKKMPKEKLKSHLGVAETYLRHF